MDVFDNSGEKMRDFSLSGYILIDRRQGSMAHTQGRKDPRKTGEARTVPCFRCNINVEPVLLCENVLHTL